MRRVLMAATMLTALGFAGATTASADGYNGQRHGYDNSYPNSQGNAYGNSYGNDYGNASGNSYGQGGEQGYSNRDDDRRDREWQRSWRPWQGYHDRDQVLSYWKLERRIERQGYFNIRNLHPSRFGYGWTAFARDRFGRHVALRVNPYNGRVLDVRVLYRR